ncbi:hypothetical protein ACHAW5_009498 [Stephanodiscus triporus]|uniref:Uncharacterized protein n=1 Tax=Stephanodiscus triporus TaxID=2934178 RepID=A0ABD3PZP7_9STRA
MTTTRTKMTSWRWCHSDDINFLDVWEYTITTKGFLSDSCSHPVTINGGYGNDNFDILRNKCVVDLNGDGTDRLTHVGTEFGGVVIRVSDRVTLKTTSWPVASLTMPSTCSSKLWKESGRFVASGRGRFHHDKGYVGSSHLPITNRVR